MAWLTLLLAVLLQAGAPSAPAPSSPRHMVAAPVRARLRPAAGPSTTMLASVDQQRPQLANGRPSQPRTSLVADAFGPNGEPCVSVVQPPAGESLRIATPDGVPDPFLRYARIIFPVPPPR